MNAEKLARALKAVRSGRQWKCRCVAHEDRNPSMIIFDGREAVQVRCMAGCEPQDIIAVLRSRGLWEGSEQQETPEPVKRERNEEEKKQHRLRVLARGIFDEARPIKGSLAETYFESRDLHTVARMIEDIRYHYACPRYSGPQYLLQPAVVIAMRSVATNAITAIQRIFLTRTGRKDGKGMMLGQASGAAMKLQHLQNHSVHICEGLETGLAIIAMDRGPVWALGSTSNIENFAVIASVSDLTIWADRDMANSTPKSPTAKSPGLYAAEQCYARWQAAGRTCRMLKSRTPTEDAADVWRNRNARL
jgi:hypothetical protein